MTRIHTNCYPLRGMKNIGKPVNFLQKTLQPLSGKNTSHAEQLVSTDAQAGELLAVLVEEGPVVAGLGQQSGEAVRPDTATIAEPGDAVARQHLVEDLN